MDWVRWIKVHLLSKGIAVGRMKRSYNQSQALRKTKLEVKCKEGFRIYHRLNKLMLWFSNHLIEASTRVWARDHRAVLTVLKS